MLSANLSTQAIYPHLKVEKWRLKNVRNTTGLQVNVDNREKNILQHKTTVSVTRIITISFENIQNVNIHTRIISHNS